MAWIGAIRNKKKARKYLVETGQLPGEFQQKVIKTVEVSYLTSLKRATYYKWPFFFSLIVNVVLIWRIYE